MKIRKNHNYNDLFKILPGLKRRLKFQLETRTELNRKIGITRNEIKRIESYLKINKTKTDNKKDYSLYYCETCGKHFDSVINLYKHRIRGGC